jgi:hypothetical protein
MDSSKWFVYVFDNEIGENYPFFNEFFQFLKFLDEYFLNFI